MQVLQRLHDAVRRKRCVKWQGQWFLHHDNAPSHTSRVVQQFVTKKNIPVITQPPYSLDLAPSDFWLSRVSRVSRGQVSQPWKNMTAERQKVPKEAFYHCFQQWQDRWSKCVCARKGPTLKVIR
ncbi:hypothetical protein B7P43_G05382 [Cryptotermes secundus]|uniref:Tc1-like transposase DDE domain-containing protein n=1 Tax=Cryptotermes secundus TaxID=105785 RepID=A0A2J7Q7J9_9NEOP|nr:hypothetical protein B7P43_G05382 [Cryptotermes secundus]